jgi:plasmid maintenance system antidote protein VapI
MEHPLRQFRTVNGLRPRDLADKLGISAVQVWRLEKRKRDITPEMALKIEQTLGIPRWQSRPDLWPAPEQGAAA